MPSKNAGGKSKVDGFNPDPMSSMSRSERRRTLRRFKDSVSRCRSESNHSHFDDLARLAPESKRLLDTAGALVLWAEASERNAAGDIRGFEERSMAISALMGYPAHAIPSALIQDAAEFAGFAWAWANLLNKTMGDFLVKHLDDMDEWPQTPSDIQAMVVEAAARTYESKGIDMSVTRSRQGLDKPRDSETDVREGKDG